MLLVNRQGGKKVNRKLLSISSPKYWPSFSLPYTY